VKRNEAFQEQALSYRPIVLLAMEKRMSLKSSIVERASVGVAAVGLMLLPAALRERALFQKRNEFTRQVAGNRWAMLQWL
jgi:hypothetical protein